MVVALKIVPGSLINRNHATGIKLRHHGYYTVASLNELVDSIGKSGKYCLVRNFTVDREGYGHVFFPRITNVVSLDLDSRYKLIL